MYKRQEQYCLFRLGDSGFPKQQLQFAANEIKFPKADEGKLLQPSEWYHVAVTYDTEAKTAAIYVDGKLPVSYTHLDVYKRQVLM